MNDLMRHRAEDDARDAAEAARPHDDGVAVLFHGAGSDLVGGEADSYMRSASDS